MPLSTTPGTPYTWATAAWSWVDVRAGKSWAEAYPAIYLETDTEALSTAELRTSDALLIDAEAFAVAEFVVREIGAFDAETIAIAETYIDLIAFILSVLESVSVAELPAKDLGVLDTEAFGTTDALVKESAKLVAESLTTTEGYIDLVAFISKISESIGLAEARMSGVTHPNAEAFSVLDRLVRRANAVIADLAIRSTGLTQEAFSAMIAAKRPLGNYPPKQLQPGDYRYARAILSLMLEDVARTTRDVSIDQAKLVVDVPDVMDRGSAVLTSSGDTVLFDRSFYGAPEVQVIQTAGSTRAIPSVTTITATGFFVRLYDAANPATPVAGTISWTALGK